MHSAEPPVSYALKPKEREAAAKLKGGRKEEAWANEQAPLAQLPFLGMPVAGPTPGRWGDFCFLT